MSDALRKMITFVPFLKGPICAMNDVVSMKFPVAYVLVLCEYVIPPSVEYSTHTPLASRMPDSWSATIESMTQLKSIVLDVGA